ncbi:methyltransferase domain-containing protein [Nakamurella antarctica]|uniref:Methyltransferase domain-containing protein n=1 Tax=Nakamurella antarctica TaxID=1902245 RepID=A0A3G8ZSB3_9ACTN|nr:methyltransferase domain-containing protein [Nakamurella antarctica]AZI57404.1 methyltransferase domain-containing protein [Nakamurella antarctica]
MTSDSSPATPTEASASAATRWENEIVGERWDDYVAKFQTMFDEGSDLSGEARFVDMMAPRGADLMDAGCGMGRVTAALHAAGHHVIGVDKDVGLVKIGRERHPEANLIAHDLLTVSSAVITAAGGPASFDVIAVPGNVMVFLAPGTEQAVLSNLLVLLKPGGRIVTGFFTTREYTVAEFDDAAKAVGLTLEHRFATWHLDPFVAESEWAVSVLRAPGEASAAC